MGAFYWFQTLKETDPFLKGDVNIDFSINVSDIVMMVEFIINNNLTNQSQLYTSDYNLDNVVDIIDLVLILNFILSN